MGRNDRAVGAAREHLARGRWVAARDVLLRAGSDDPEVVGVLVEALVIGADLARARHWLERLTKMAPDHPGTWRLACRVALASRDAPGAEAAAERWANLEPGEVVAWLNLSWVYREHSRFAAAREAARRGLGVSPDHPELARRVALNTLALGRAEEAAADLARLAARFPDDLAIAQLRASAMNLEADADAGGSLAAHRRFGALLARGAGPPKAGRRRPTPGGTPRRLAIISPDLHRHSVSFFARALLEEHEATGLEVLAIDTLGLEDATKAAMRSLLPHGRFLRAIRGVDPPLGELLRTHGVDVGVELSGLTGDHRLAELAADPPALLVTYLGYPNTTGVEGVDARVVDATTDPEGTTLATERLVRIAPCFVCYRPSPPLVPIAPEPGGRGGSGARFGCFNALKKLTDATLDLFARALAAAPGSTLTLKARGLDEASTTADVSARLRARGVEASRVTIAGFVGDDAAHLAWYNRVDVALDTFPYAGTTTTCEALLMGVPVVTLAGRTHASRVGASLLSAAGRAEWIAGDAGSYARIAAGIGSTGRDAGAREALRAEFLGSALCDAPAFARAFGEAIRRAWCDAAGA